MRSSALISFALGACGMLLGHAAARRLDAGMPAAVAAGAAPAAPSLTAQQVEIVGPRGERRILLGVGPQGAPGIWFFDDQGKVRLNLGVYPDGDAFLVLNDPAENAVELARTVGGAPYLILKAAARDRMILGLNGPAADPFFVRYDAAGAKTTVFGAYP